MGLALPPPLSLVDASVSLTQCEALANGLTDLLRLPTDFRGPVLSAILWLCLPVHAGVPAIRRAFAAAVLDVRLLTELRAWLFRHLH